MMGVTDRKTSLLNQGSPTVGHHGFWAGVQLRVHEARHQEGLAGSQLWKLPDCYGKILNITRSTGTRRRLSSFYKDKWWPSLFPEGEKSLNPFVHQNMLFLHGTRLSCPPCSSPRSPHEQKWNPSSHDITYHSAFLLLQSSQRRLHLESLSHNAAQAAASDQRANGIYRDIQGP